jgi:copper chaperone
MSTEASTRHEFTLPDLSCGHCVKSVTAAAQALDAGARVEADIASKYVSINSAQPREALVAALTEAGYPPVAATTS